MHEREVVRVVESEDGVRHELVKRLGVGGQGEVWLTGNPRRVVKLRAPGVRAETVRRQFAAVRRLPLGGLHVARPLSLLRAPSLGYVAEFLDEMVSARTLLSPGRGEPFHEWWLRTGGLRRRLRLLAHMAEVVAALHERGLVYGDLSASNVFISADAERCEAWLIDLDNVRPDTDASAIIYTPDFGAPELVSATRGISSLADAWSFAVLACWTLTLIHPFKGELVADGECELEEDALAGRLPWVGDRVDTRNATSHGLPLPNVLSPKLWQHMDKALTAGRLDRLARPTVGSWVVPLHAAADRTLTCPSCCQTYYDQATRCPWCDVPRPRHGRLAFFFSDERRSVEPTQCRAIVTLDRGRPTVVTRRMTALAHDLDGRRPVLTLEAREGAVHVTPTGEAPVWVADSATAAQYRQLPLEGLPLAYGKTWLHFEPPERPHRMATLTEVAG